MTERMTNRKRQAIEMKKRIQTAALDLFNQKGFENVSIEELAQEAGCSVGNIYHYFKNKEALAASVPAYVDAYYEELEGVYLTDQSRSAMDKLLDFVEQALEISSNDALIWQSFVYSLKSPELGVLKLKPERAYFQVLGRLIKGCQAEGSVAASCSVEELVWELVILHRGILIQWRVCEGDFDIKAQGRRMADALLKGHQQRASEGLTASK